MSDPAAVDSALDADYEDVLPTRATVERYAKWSARPCSIVSRTLGWRRLELKDGCLNLGDIAEGKAKVLIGGLCRCWVAGEQAQRPPRCPRLSSVSEGAKDLTGTAQIRVVGRVRSVAGTRIAHSEGQIQAEG